MLPNLANNIWTQHSSTLLASELKKKRMDQLLNWNELEATTIKWNDLEIATIKWKQLKCTESQPVAGPYFQRLEYEPLKKGQRETFSKEDNDRRESTTVRFGQIRTWWSWSLVVGEVSLRARWEIRTHVFRPKQNNCPPVQFLFYAHVLDKWQNHLMTESLITKAMH